VLDEHAVVLHGYVQHRSEQGRVVTVQKVWLYVVVDEKLFRSEVFDTEAAALEAYRSLGITLGTSSPTENVASAHAQQHPREGAS
jgi:hypothetical protein